MRPLPESMMINLDTHRDPGGIGSWSVPFFMGVVFMFRYPSRLQVNRLLGVLILAGTASTCGGDVDAFTEPLAPRRPAAIILFPSVFSLDEAGESLQIAATVRDDAGFDMSGVRVDWESSDEGVARVDSSGLVTAVASGECTITAFHQTIRARAQVTVN